MTVRALYELKDSGRAFWKRGTQVRVEDKGDGILGGKNNRDEGRGEIMFFEEKEDTTKWRGLFVSVGYELELVKWGFIEEAPGR